MGQSSTNVFERISAEYYNLTPAEKKAADYVLSHQRKTQDMSITELAAESGRGGGDRVALLPQARVQGL